jgi:exopolyphosphatase/guanosine-5'-triphosphate,3'-diphosphate pyrophosphatase
MWLRGDNRPEGRQTAVIDLGSNSVRLVIYRLEGRAIWTIFNEKALAGLGRGLPSTGRLSADGVEVALAGTPTTSPSWRPRRCARPPTARRSCAA